MDCFILASSTETEQSSISGVSPTPAANRELAEGGDRLCGKPIPKGEAML
ncbi:hypothetical protein [Ruminococcus sp. NK3A76]|nr:hypothetical protein [Ruminococcus sp. NK3A76]